MPSIQKCNIKLDGHLNDRKAMTSKNVVLFLLATSILSNMIVILTHRLNHREISSSLALTMLSISSATTGFFLMGWVILDYLMNSGKCADIDEDDDPKMIKTPHDVNTRSYGSISSSVSNNNNNNVAYPMAKVALS